MPKEKNKDLNPYYLELLKYLVIYKYKNRLGIDLSIDERDGLASELNEYNTKDSLNRIFSQGEKRRQNFNKSNLQGLCKYIGYEDWEHFVVKEHQAWADDLEEKLYNDIDPEILKKINKTIFIRILQEVEGKINDGISDYFIAYIKQENEEISDEEISKKLQTIMRIFNFCVDYIAEKTDEAHLMVIYKTAENIDEKRYFFDGFELPKIFKGELYTKIKGRSEINVVDELIENVENPLDKEIMRLYKEGYPDQEIMVYLNYQGININLNDIKLIRWQTADKIFNQLKTQNNGNGIFQD
jgi:hypothetical protein